MTTTLTTIARALRTMPPEAWQQIAEPEQLADQKPAPETDEGPDDDQEEHDPAQVIRQPRRPGKSNPLRRKNAALFKIVGARLMQAREMCGMTLSEAARQLGYANPSKLSKVEHASDAASVPFWLIPEAAQLYDVSTEFLFGLSDDFETGCWRGITPFLQQQWDAQRKRDLKALAVLNKRFMTAAEALPALASAADYMLGAVEVVEEKNRHFDDMPGGARLKAAARRLQAAAAEVLKAQRQLHLELPPELIEETQNA
jgi:transcriptional regulator with XRE-family HTH domain